MTDSTVKTTSRVLIYLHESEGVREASDFTAKYLKKHRLSLPVIAMQNIDSSASSTSTTDARPSSLLYSLLPNKMKSATKSQASKLSSKGERSSSKVGERSSSKLLKTVAEEGAVDGAGDDVTNDGL